MWSTALLVAKLFAALPVEKLFQTLQPAGSMKPFEVAFQIELIFFDSSGVLLWDAKSKDGFAARLNLSDGKVQKYLFLSLLMSILSLFV